MLGKCSNFKPQPDAHKTLRINLLQIKCMREKQQTNNGNHLVVTVRYNVDSSHLAKNLSYTSNCKSLIIILNAIFSKKTYFYKNLIVGNVCRNHVQSYTYKNASKILADSSCFLSIQAQIIKTNSLPWKTKKIQKLHDLYKSTQHILTAFVCCRRQFMWIVHTSLTRSTM